MPTPTHPAKPPITRTLAGVLCIACVVGSTAHAATYNQSADVSGSGFGDPGSALGPNTDFASDGFNGTRTVRSGLAIARAQDGFLSGFVAASIEPGPSNPVPSGVASARASASLMLTDIVVTRLPGFESLPDLVDVTAQVSFAGDTAFGNLSNVGGGLDGGTTFDPGLLSALNPTMTSTGTLTVGQPTSLSLFAGISVEVNSKFDSLESRFTVSLGGSPAFLVPEGYTVNSIDGSVVNNFYVGPVLPVPEPASTLACLGLCLFLTRRRPRR